MIIHKLDVILVGAMYFCWFFFQKLKSFNNVWSQEIFLAPYEINQSFASMLNKTMAGCNLLIQNNGLHPTLNDISMVDL